MSAAGSTQTEAGALASVADPAGEIRWCTYAAAAVLSFLSLDPAREFANPYAYVGWDPINATDPTGECVAICLLIAVGIAFVPGFANAMIHGASVGQALGAGFMAGVVAGFTAPIMGGLLEPLACGMAGFYGGTVGLGETASSVAAAMTLGGPSAVYGLTQGDYAGAIGLGIGIGIMVSGRGALAKEGGLGRKESGGSQRQSLKVTADRIDESLEWLSRNAERVEFKGLPRDAISVAAEDIPDATGFTRCEVFGCSEVVLDPVMQDQAELTATLWHEARHFNAGFFERHFMANALGINVLGTRHNRLHFWDIDLANAIRSGTVWGLNIPLHGGQVDLSVPHPVEGFAR